MAFLFHSCIQRVRALKVDRRNCELAHTVTTRTSGNISGILRVCGPLAGLYDMSQKLIIKSTFMAACLCLVAACAKEPPPRSVEDFVEDPILLEATIVRCAQNRAETKYEAECVSAKQAASRITRAEDRARRDELEEQSIRKRAALRRTQEARAEARRRAAETERLRREAEYLGVYDEDLEPQGNVVVSDTEGVPTNDVTSNAPTALVEEPDPQNVDDPRQGEMQPPGAAAAGDIDSIRDELRRRQEADQQ